MSGKKYIYFVTLTAALGGFLFGFDTAVISGAIPFIKTYFSLSELAEGWAVGCLIIGCMIGAGISGNMSDLFGRKKVLILTAVLFACSSVWSALATTFPGFIIARMICGIGVGAASVLSPTYIAEISPAKVRGRLVSLNQLMIVIGILIVYFTNYLLLKSGDNNWRWMLGSEVIPSVIFLIFLFFIPESPRWYVKNNQRDAALDVLQKAGGEEHARRELKAIDDTLQNQQKVGIGALFKGKMRIIIILGILLACFQQITGINAIIYYAPTIFMKAGASAQSAFWQPVIIGTVNLAFTFVAIWLIDKVGRKVLMLFGSAGMAISLGFLVWAFLSNHLHGYGVLICILGYIASFAASLAPVMWVVTSEMYPNRIRGAAMSVSTFFSWGCTYLVVQSFPWMLSQLGGGFAFGIFGVLSVVTFFFVWIYIPETKGKSLEAIEAELFGETVELVE